MRRRHRRYAFLALIASMTLALVASTGRAAVDQDLAASERSVKAAYLYKFLGYVEWPASAFASPDAPITIGIMGAEDVAAELGAIVASRTIDNRPVVVRRLREGESLAGVHVVFVGRGDAGRVRELARSARDRGVLVVTESTGALDVGSMINFVVDEGRVRFEIAPSNAERAGVKLSSRLLAVAQAVRTP